MSTSLLGAHEAAELLGLTREGLRLRRLSPDFPTPVELRCGPVWTRKQLVSYARRRAERYHERAPIAALAGLTVFTTHERGNLKRTDA